MRPSTRQAKHMRTMAPLMGVALVRAIEARANRCAIYINGVRLPDRTMPMLKKSSGHLTL